MTLSTDTLIQTARDTYGELIELIVVYPQGINVQLIGFECATYGQDGSYGVSWRVPMRYMARIKLRELTSALRR